MKSNAHRTMKPMAGFTLIEALIGLLVLAFGMLAIAAFQTSLSRSGDVSKQRTEATRLAQEKMECLRSFAQIASAAAATANCLGAMEVKAWNSTSSGNDTPTTSTNTSYTRTWTVGGTIDDWQRSLRVQVAWSDRAGSAQAVTLDSVISQSDPANVGSLNVPMVENGILRRPKGRDINIPIPATALGGDNKGKSKLQWTGASSGWLVFSNDTGNVVYKCSSEPTDSTNLASACSALDDYLLVGYISGDISNSSSNYMGLSLGSNTTIFASLGISFSSTQYIVGTPECIVANAVDQNNGTVIAGYIAYSCLIQPSDHDSNPATPKVWSGRTDITPAPTVNNKVCRYSDGGSSNMSHPATYSLVTESLDNQNFYIIKSGSCPSGTVQHAP